MARLIRVPLVASLLLVSKAEEIDDLIGHPGLMRAFVRKGGLVNRFVVAGLDRQFRQKGQVLPAFLPREDAARAAGQQTLFANLDRLAQASAWPRAPVSQMARYVATGREQREAEAALAYAIASPFLGSTAGTTDDTYKPKGRYLWRLHRRIARARKRLSLSGLAYRVLGVDRRSRAAILAAVGNDAYGLHAVEFALANARVILEQMRHIVRDLADGRMLDGRALAWAAVRTAPESVVRQTGATALTLPHVSARVPPHTLVLLSMRRALTGDDASGYEFASTHWSACPARRFVMELFGAVGSAAVELADGKAPA